MTDRYERIRAALAMGPTPGPWAWGHNSASSDVIHCIEVTAEGGIGSVAYLQSYTADDYDDRAETISNARLIAACDPDTIRELLAERDQLAAALEEAREDAERYRWLRKGNNDDIAVVRGLGAMDYGMSGVAYTYSEEIDGADLDAAIAKAAGRMHAIGE